ncbi:MAG: hypothetical protein WD897_01925 [Parcubacteria group bacterium]
MSKIIVALTLALTTLANSAYAEFRWKHPGADPYAISREAAMQTRESAFQKLGFPEEVVRMLVEETKKPGEKVKLVMGHRLTTMLSKDGTIHRDVVIAWESPIRGTELIAPAERWQVTWGGQVFTVLSFEVCYNWSSIIAPAPKQKTAANLAPVVAVAAGTCPNGWSLIAHAWSLPLLPAAMQKEATKLTAVAKDRDTRNATDPAAYQGDAVSRVLGGRLRREVQTRAPVDVDLQVFYRDPQTAVVVEVIGLLRVDAGTGSLLLPGDPRQWIVETVWPRHFISPTESGGERRLWLFPKEWGKWCSMNVHGILP